MQYWPSYPYLLFFIDWSPPSHGFPPTIPGDHASLVTDHRPEVLWWPGDGMISVRWSLHDFHETYFVKIVCIHCRSTISPLLNVDGWPGLSHNEIIMCIHSSWYQSGRNCKWPSTFPNDPIKRIRVTRGHANKCLRQFRMDIQDYYVIGISGVVGNWDGNCYSLILNLMLHNSPQINVQ